jgi:hypothetical protein
MKDLFICLKLVIHFSSLSKDENVELIVKYLTMISTTETNLNYLKDETLEKEYFKFPFLACEIILCGIKSINEKILKVDLLKKYFSFLEEREKVKNIINSSSDYYFTKTLKYFLKNNYVEITNYLMEKGDWKR